MISQYFAITSLALTLFSGCDFINSTNSTAAGPVASPQQNKPISASGGSANAVKVENGVMRVSLVLIENEPVLQIAGENIRIYRSDKTVNSTALGQWFKAVELSNADFPPEKRVTLDKVEIAVGPGVSEDAVKACISVIQDLGIDVVTEPQEQPAKQSSKVTESQRKIPVPEEKSWEHKTYSDDKKLFAIYFRDGWDEVISIHDAASGKQVRSIVGHGDDVKEFKFSDDGKLLASRCANSHRTGWAVWSVETGDLLIRLPNGNTSEPKFK